jgi:hypothetical protein
MLATVSKSVAPEAPRLIDFTFLKIQIRNREQAKEGELEHAFWQSQNLRTMDCADR